MLETKLEDLVKYYLNAGKAAYNNFLIFNSNATFLSTRNRIKIHNRTCRHANNYFVKFLHSVSTRNDEQHERTIPMDVVDSLRDTYKFLYVRMIFNEAPDRTYFNLIREMNKLKAHGYITKSEKKLALRDIERWK